MAWVGKCTGMHCHPKVSEPNLLLKDTWMEISAQKRKIKLVPQNQQAVFVFCPEADMDAYFFDKKEFARKASVRTLGRGMVCLDMDDYDKIVDVSSFVRTYQKNAGLLIGSIEEIAYNMGFIDTEQLICLADNVSYASALKQIARKGKAQR